MNVYSFSENDVRDMVKQCIEQFGGTGWEYLAKQFPVLLDDKLSAIDKFNLDAHDTFSFANQYYVGFSESRALKQITDYYSAKKLSLSWSELQENVRDVLIHEYGHILLEHVFQKPMTKQLDAEAQVVTAEIETNRGIPKSSRAKYFDEVIISDDKEDFQTVKPYITHKAIFDEVKRLWKSHKDKQNNPQDDECSDNGGGGDNDKQKDSSGKEQQGSNSTTPTPSTDQKSEQNSGQENEQNGAQSGDQQQEQIKKPDHVGTMVQAMRDAQSNDAQPRDLLSELGLQASEDFKDGDVHERLQILTELAQNNEIKKTLSKIKGSLAGELSKERIGTYSRPSRKTSEDGMMRKGTKRGATKRPSILIALDESGSMDTTAVKTAATAIKLVSKTIGRNRSDIKICKFNNVVTMVKPLARSDELVENYYPRGGTNFDSVINLARDSKCDVVLCIGDGMGTLPNETNGIKWLDILITPYGTVDNVKQYCYTDADKNGRRETLWLGNNRRRVEQFAMDM